jgi:K+-sensing histidine kinase KdpD
LRVCDGGLGVLPEDRDRIFEKYVRLEPGQHQRTSRGLGLVFCRLAAEVHEGQIWVQPNEPTGSSFCVRLPIAGPSARQKAESSAPLSALSKVVAGDRP